MTILEGKEFKKKYGNTFYRWFSKDFKHGDFQYEIGLNELDESKEKFNPLDIVNRSGLYFVNGENIFEFLYYSHGPYIGEIEIPDDAKVYVVEGSTEFRCDKLVLKRKIKNEKDILKILKICRKNGGYLNTEDATKCALAALNGHLHILKWLRENGCKWNSWTCENAKDNGRTEISKWLRENGCPCGGEFYH